MPVTVRTSTNDDDAAIVALIARADPDAPPISPEEYHAGAERSLQAGTGEQWVAEKEGAITGMANYSHAWWTNSPTIYSVELRVDPPRRHRGIGTALYEQLRRNLSSRGATAMLVWLDEANHESRRFAQQRGFQATGEVVEDCRLELSSARLDGIDALEERLKEEGITVHSLNELDLSNQELLLEVQRVSAEGEEPAMTLDAWRAVTLDGPGCSPQTYWVALHNGAPVGLTFLKRLSADAAENDYTGVSRAYWSRGIATVLKAHAIRWGVANGLRSFHTCSVVENDRMIGINYRLGYVPGSRRTEMRRDL